MRSALLAAALLLLPAARAQQGAREEQLEIVAEVKESTQVKLTFPAEARFLIWVIHVPPGCAGLMVLTLGEGGDLDLYLRRGAPIKDYRRDPEAQSTGPEVGEMLFLDQGSKPALQPGTWFLYVVHPRPGTALDFELIVKLGQAPGIAYSGRARRHKSEGDLKRALADCERALELEPEEARNWETRAQVRAALGDRAGAMADHARGVALAPERLAGVAEVAATGTWSLPMTARGLGVLKVLVPEGCERLKVGVQGTDKDVDLCLRYGLPPEDPQRDADHRRASFRSDEQVWVERGDVPLGITPGPWYLVVSCPEERGPLQVSVELDPPGSPSKDPRWWYDRGLMHDAARQPEAALRALTLAAQLDPKDPFTRLGRAEAFKDLGRWSEAAREYGQVLALAPAFPGMVSVLLGRATCLREAGDHEAALRDLDLLAQRSPRLAEVHYQRALVRLARGEQDAALEDLERALRLEPRDWRSLVQRAQLRAARGEREAARQDYETAMRIAPAQVLAGLEAVVDAPRQVQVPFPAGRKARTYVLILPEDVLTLTVDLRGGPSVKAQLRWGLPPGRGGSDYEAVGAGSKRLVLSRDSVPSLRPGPWFLELTRESGAEEAGEVEMGLRWTREAP